MHRVAIKIRIRSHVCQTFLTYSTYDSKFRFTSEKLSPPNFSRHASISTITWIAESTSVPFECAPCERNPVGGGKFGALDSRINKMQTMAVA